MLHDRSPHTLQHNFSGSSISVSRDSIARAESLAPIGDSWTFLPPTDSSTSSVVAIRPVVIAAAADFVPSVVGIAANVSYLKTLMSDHMNGAEMSCDDGETHCYLLDEGGYVIYSNQVSLEAEWELVGGVYRGIVWLIGSI